MCNQIQGIATVERSVGRRQDDCTRRIGGLVPSTSDTLGSGLEGVADVGERLLIDFGSDSLGSDFTFHLLFLRLVGRQGMA